MRRPERVVLALRAPGEARQPAALAQRADPLPAPGQDLVRIGLVADIPDQDVPRRVEHIVQRHRQLDHPETRPEMPARHRHRRDHLRPQLVRQLPQLARLELAQIRRGAHLVEQRRPGAAGHTRSHHSLSPLSSPIYSAICIPDERQTARSRHFLIAARSIDRSAAELTDNRRLEDDDIHRARIWRR